MPKGGPMIGRKFIKPEVKEAQAPPAVEQMNVFLKGLDLPAPLLQQGGEPIELTPEEAAECLLGFLPEETQELIREAREARGVPLWHMLLGYVMAQAEVSGLFSPYVLAAWDAGVRPNEAHPCKSCGLKFKSRFPGAQNCCNPCAFGKDKHADDCPTHALVSA